MMFHQYIGIDYSGGGTPLTRTTGLQIFSATAHWLPKHVISRETPRDQDWCRKEVADWLIDLARSDKPFIAGLDFSFSLPLSYFQRYGLTDWDAFLDDFVAHWPTDRDDATVAELRPGNLRTGTVQELRLTEQWTSSAKSNFLFGVPGQVACSTHAGIPWLSRIRSAVGDKVHFWPFDGWDILDSRSVMAEIFPPMFRRRYLAEDRTVDQQDAYAVARWLKEMDQGQSLDIFFHPPLSPKQKRRAEKEGWILGVL